MGARTGGADSAPGAGPAGGAAAPRGKLDVALVQVGSGPDKAHNLQVAARFIREAAGAGARLVVFPEMFMGAPSAERPPRAFAEPLDGPFVRGLAGEAKAAGAYVVAGVWETSDDPARPFNTAVVVEPSGRVVAAYRKLHLFDALGVRESHVMRPGSARPPVWEIDGVPLGVAICYDLRFPELFRELAARGAEAVVVPAAWYSGILKEEHWLTLLRARAIENTLYVLGADQAGGPFCGRSAGFDPFGVTLGDAGEDEGLLLVHVDRARVQAVRRKLPSLQHRRTDLYG
ncbi:MAG: carbon-nitrogen hydrolase family protein [Limnochordaceae bacterium]|nr:carbon-nitrogen hydrolase family protein [Limnochordaceae bacterium]